jgi:hypothetical protein
MNQLLFFLLLILASLFIGLELLEGLIRVGKVVLS